MGLVALAEPNLASSWVGADGSGLVTLQPPPPPIPLPQSGLVAST